ncbi:phosphatidylglycerol lysyltransferase domain-containing protein [Paenirhodobacter sp.]|uniref:phosphatidylglycerol lysyltransferase domain-containing protein n=1 Tax=Paenirhodobacter sp. TaxID=1965326 RepID=UPI003B3DC364
MRFSEDQRAFVMFARRRADWIALGDPVGPFESGTHAGWAFAEAARNANCRPVFFEVSAARLPLMVEMGLACHEIGEEAIVRLRDVPPGPVDGIDLHQPPHSAELLAELRAVSDVWLADRIGRDKRFSVGLFSEDYLNRFPLAVMRQEGRVVAFANLLAPGSGRRVSMDLMRYRPEGGVALLETFLHALIAHCRDAGAEECSLGLTPLAGLGKRRMARLWTRFGNVMFRHGSAFADFDELRAFKARFNPEWHPRYIALPVGVSPMLALADVAALIKGGRR